MIVKQYIKDFECFLSMHLLDFENHLCAYLNFKLITLSKKINKCLSIYTDKFLLNG